MAPRGPNLCVPLRPTDYLSLVESINLVLTTECFHEFLNTLVSYGLIEPTNAKKCLENAAPFINGAQIRLQNGSILPGDHSVTLRDDLYAKRLAVRDFEKTNGDSSHGWRSHAISKLILFQLQLVGRWNAETTAKWCCQLKTKKRPLEDMQSTVSHCVAIDAALPVVFAVPILSPQPSISAPLVPAVPILSPQPSISAPLPLPPPKHVSPPGYQQLLRCCALDIELHEWLGDKLSRKHPRDVVKRYYKRAPDQVRAAGLNPDYFSVDHVVPKNIGGLDHCYNYVLMPTEINAGFGDKWTTEKKNYVGSHAVKVTTAFSQWFRSRNEEMEDFSKFCPQHCL